MIGVIAEFNPFHLGHEYFLKKVSELFPGQKICVVQSGNFTQRGDIAVVDKYKRAYSALEAGADVVLELPLPYAVSSAEYFAKGAIKVLSGINGLDKIVFGAETDDIELLKKTALAVLDESEDSKTELKKRLKEGKSYAKALSLSFSDPDVQSVLNSPNNILAVEYIKEIIKNNLNITPFCIKREGDFSSTETNAKGFASAAAVRKAIKENGVESARELLPSYSFDTLKKAISNENLYPLIGYALAVKGKTLKDVEGFSEGIENRFAQTYFKSSSYEDFMEKLKTKRFTRTRLQRLAVCLLLDIKKTDFQSLTSKQVYAGLLAVKDKNLLKEINLPLIKGARDIAALNDDAKELAALTQKADFIYALAVGDMPLVKKSVF